MEKHKAYLDFVRYAITPGQSVPKSARGIDWKDFAAFCHRQGVSGLVFAGIDKLDDEDIRREIPREVLYSWLALAEKTKARNKHLNECTLEIVRFFEKEGCRSCILKGQANAMMYPWPEQRTPGDIDIWVEGNDENIIRLVLRHAPDAHYSLHHVVFPYFKDVSVEVHYRPIFLDNRLLDQRLKKHIDKIKDEQFAHRIPFGDHGEEIGCLTDDFNAVYLLLHMWHHFFSTRNNLKQLIDYFFFLKQVRCKKKDVRDLFCELGVLKYAQGVMWVMHEVLGLDKQYLVVEPSEKIGRVVLAEMLNYGVKKKRNKVGLLFGRLADNSHLFRYFPSAVIGSPVHLVWHQWWKWNMKRKLNHTTD